MTVIKKVIITGQMVPKLPTKNYDGYLVNRQIHHQVKIVSRCT